MRDGNKELNIFFKEQALITRCEFLGLETNVSMNQSIDSAYYHFQVRIQIPDSHEEIAYGTRIDQWVVRNGCCDLWHLVDSAFAKMREELRAAVRAVGLRLESARLRKKETHLNDEISSRQHDLAGIRADIVRVDALVAR